MLNHTFVSALLAVASGGAIAQNSLLTLTELEWDNVMQRSVAEGPLESSCSLQIRGLSGHSSMVVKKTIIAHSGSAVHVHVYVGLTQSGASGSFETTVVLDPTVNLVVFGNNGAVLWRRETSKCNSIHRDSHPR